MTERHDTSNWMTTFAERRERAGGLLPYFVEEIFLYYPYINMIRKYARIGDKLLETGFGTGYTSIFLSSLNSGYKAIALDIDQQVIEEGKQNNKLLGGVIEFLRGTLFALPFKDKSISIVYHYGVLEHYDEDDIIRALKEQLRVADMVIFGIPTKNVEKQGLYGDERLWSYKKWLKLIGNNGFEIIDIDGFAAKNNVFWAAAFYLVHGINTYLSNSKLVREWKCNFSRAVVFVLRERK
jgi:SAM-dependent methyltransferase